MTNPELVRDILPRVLSHIWGAAKWEYGSTIKRCCCGAIRREYDETVEYWRWHHGKLEKLALPPPHPEKVA